MTTKDIFKKLGTKKEVEIGSLVHSVQFTGDNGREIFESLKALGFHKVQRGAKYVSWQNHEDIPLRHKVRIGEYLVIEDFTDREVQVNGIELVHYAYCVSEKMHENRFIPVPRKRKK